MDRLTEAQANILTSLKRKPYYGTPHPNVINDYLYLHRIGLIFINPISKVKSITEAGRAALAEHERGKGE